MGEIRQLPGVGFATSIIFSFHWLRRQNGLARYFAAYCVNVSELCWLIYASEEDLFINELKFIKESNRKPLGNIGDAATHIELYCCVMYKEHRTVKEDKADFDLVHIKQEKEMRENVGEGEELEGKGTIVSAEREISKFTMEALEKPSNQFFSWLLKKGCAVKVVLHDSWQVIRLSLATAAGALSQKGAGGGVEDYVVESSISQERLGVSDYLIGSTLALTYFFFKRLDPQYKVRQEARKKTKEILGNLGVSPSLELTDHEVCIAISLVDASALETSWTSIGGLEEIVTDLCDSVILPFKAAHTLMPRSRLFRAPKGVLLYGPPGCGKTLLARATAKAAGARFFNLQVQELRSTVKLVAIGELKSVLDEKVSVNQERKRIRKDFATKMPYYGQYTLEFTSYSSDLNQI
ncbi:hypothetical protein ACTXT7_004198 [Hymenolepis weldensis]